jgi:hypothetical protein
LDTAKFALAKAARKDHIAELRITSETPVNTLIDTVAKEHGLFVYEGKNGKMGICPLGEPTTTTFTLLDSHCARENGIKKSKKDYLSLDYFVSELDVRYGRGETTILSKDLLCQTELAMASKYLSGRRQKTILTLTTAPDEATAQKCARIKMLHHCTPTFEYEVELKPDLNLDVGSWIDINSNGLIGKALLIAYHNDSMKMWFKPVYSVDNFQEVFSNQAVPELLEKFITDTSKNVQEVFE